MIYVAGSPFCVSHSVSLCFFDKLQPIIAQFDLVLFVSWHKKEKKADNNLIKGKNMSP